mmetsp:Transcript_18486/g.41843  ORF Transcript_18486/g.41843 Transcript_18486/m.41843 type:complete len:231 (-) Transcript_18486:251-943(-)
MPDPEAHPPALRGVPAAAGPEVHPLRRGHAPRCEALQRADRQQLQDRASRLRLGAHLSRRGGPRREPHDRVRLDALVQAARAASGCQVLHEDHRHVGVWLRRWRAALGEATDWRHLHNRHAQPDRKHDRQAYSEGHRFSGGAVCRLLSRVPAGQPTEQDSRDGLPARHAGADRLPAAAASVEPGEAFHGRGGRDAPVPGELRRPGQRADHRQDSQPAPPRRGQVPFGHVP